MAKKKLSPELQCLREGFIVGILSGIAIKTGVDADETSIMIMLFREVCKATGNGAGHMNCGLITLLLSVIAIIITICSILQEVVKVKELYVGRKVINGVVVGLVIYGAGLLAGVLFILKFA